MIVSSLLIGFMGGLLYGAVFIWEKKRTQHHAALSVLRFFILALCLYGALRASFSAIGMFVGLLIGFWLAILRGARRGSHHRAL